MGKFSVENYFPSLAEWTRYSGNIIWDDYSVLKDHGDYIQIMFRSSASKGHDTYDLYLNDSGKLLKVCGHRGNAGFEDTKYY